MEPTSMKNFFIIIVIMILFLSSCSPSNQLTPSANAPTNAITPIPPTATEIPATPTFTPPPSTPTLFPETAFIKGVTLNNYGPNLDTSYAEEVIKQYILPAGIKYVALNPTCFGKDWKDTNIECTNEDIPGLMTTVSDQELINAIQYLHSVGLRVILKPHFLSINNLKSNLSEPRFGSSWGETEWQVWFDNYIIFISHYARIAEDNQVDLFVIGNEMEYSTQREQDWRRIIAAVREIYHGQLTYAANSWQFEASQIKFWDALDYIGTNAYSYFDEPIYDYTIDGMKIAWQPYIQRLEEISNEYGKQVLITEFGARSQDDYNTGTLHDWIATSYNGQEQSDHYKAFFETIDGKPWIKGVILWDVYTSPLQGGPNDISYTFIGKPAEQIVHGFFGGLSIAPTTVSNFVENPGETMIVYGENLAGDWRLWYEPDATTIPDLYSHNGHASSFSIRVSYSEYVGVWLIHDSPPLDMSKYKWLEFYILVGKNQPKHLLAVFEDWTTGINIGSRMALVNNPNYIEGGQYEPGTWQRVRIPLIDLGITDQRSTGFNILGCAWPCDFDNATDDVYIDDIKLIAGE